MDEDLEKTEILDDLEKTKVLENLGDISEAMTSSENRLEEIKEELKETVEEVTPTREEFHKEKGKKNLKERWHDLSKKAKVLWITGIILGVAIIIGVVIYFVFFFSKKEDPIVEPPKEETPILVEDNYKYQDGVLTFLNNKKDEIGTYTCTNGQEDLCMVGFTTNKEDQFDEPKRVYEDNTPIEMRSNIYFDRYAFVVDHKEEEPELYQLYDIKEQKTLGIYQVVKTYNHLENKVILKNNEGKYGYYEITSDGLKEIIAPSYEYLGMNSDEHYQKDEILVAKEKNMYYLITNKNKKITKGITNPIIGYNDAVIAAGSAKKYMLYNNVGEPLTKGTNEYIHIGKDYYIFHNDNKATVYLNDGTKLNEVGITIGKIDEPYPIKVYSKEGEFKEEKTPYTIINNIDNGEITVVVGEKEQTLNIYEGLASKDKMVGYYNGVLYFYRDKQVIGTYRCENKNDLNKDNYTKEWTGCRVAKRDVSHLNATNEFFQESDKAVMTMPIYANQYVFIYDGDASSKETGMIKLYDLKSKRVLVSYNMVYDRALKDTTLIAAEGTILAQNKDKEFGVILIRENQTKGIVPFEYEMIEYAASGYYAKDKEGWHILDQTGKEIAVLANRVKNHSSKGAAVEEDGKYYIYGLDGTKLQLDGYQYVLAEDEYYVTVSSDNELLVYDYNGTALMNEPIILQSKKYYGVEKPAFKVEKSGNQLTVYALNGEDYGSTTYNVTTGANEE